MSRWRDMPKSEAHRKLIRKADIDATLNFQSRNPVEIAYNRATPVQHERAEQKALVRWVNLQWWCEDFSHIPNERRDKREAQRLKAEGVRKGMPDNMLFLRIGNCSGAASELKRVGATRSAVTEDQRNRLLRLEANGWTVGAHRGWDEARQFFEAYVAQGWCGDFDYDWWR